jgi:hypothetical protein
VSDSIPPRTQRQDNSDYFRYGTGRYEGYRVSKDGEISFRKENRWVRLREYENEKGYLRVNIARENKRVHRLVLEAFRGPCPEGMEACHKNGKPWDNRLENLRWGTPKSNANDKKTHGTYKSGESHPNSKLTDEKVRRIRKRLRNGYSVRSTAKKFFVAEKTIRDVRDRKLWTHVSD